MTIAALLEPIAEHGPCGVSLLDEPEYDAIALARHEDDPTLPLGVWTKALKRADWQESARLCRQALVERSKDLNLAAWLGEAWINIDGLEGGARATLLLQGLCERYWDDLHPLMHKGEIDYRTKPLDWIDEHWSMALLLRVPLIHGSGADARTVTLAQWKDSLARENDERKVKKPGKDGDSADLLTRTRALAQLASMPVARLQTLLGTVRDWSGALRDLHATLDRLMAAQAPRLRKLAATLDETERVLGTWLEAHPAHVAAPVAPAPAAPAGAPPVAAPEPAASGDEAPLAPTPAAAGPAGRAGAYRRLESLADYLETLEPHSPVPRLVRRAVAWGNLSFDQLLVELTHNNNEMQKLLVRGPVGS